MSINRLESDGSVVRVPEPEPAFDVVRVFWMRECAECYAPILPFQRARKRRGRFFHGGDCFELWWAKWKNNLRWIEREEG